MGSAHGVKHVAENAEDFERAAEAAEATPRRWRPAPQPRVPGGRACVGGGGGGREKKSRHKNVYITHTQHRGRGGGVGGEGVEGLRGKQQAVGEKKRH
jgi:hypothetical protein